jgi:hypothetical protein
LRRGFFPWLLTLPLLTVCTRLDAIPVAPPQTAATWLTSQPVSAIKIGAQEVILIVWMLYLALVVVPRVRDADLTGCRRSTTIDLCALAPFREHSRRFPGIK